MKKILTSTIAILVLPVILITGCSDRDDTQSLAQFNANQNGTNGASINISNSDKGFSLKAGNASDSISISAQDGNISINTSRNR